MEGQRPKFDQQDLRSFEWYYLWRLCYAGRRLGLHGHLGPVTGLVFAPDGETLASCSQDRTVRLWDPITGRERSKLTAERASRFTWLTYTAVAYSPDGKTVAAASWGGTVSMWDATTGRLRATLMAGPTWLRSLAISHDGRTIATAADAIKLWDVVTLQKQATLPGNRGFLSVAFSPDDKIVAAGGTESVKWWTRGSDGWREKATLTGHGFGPPVAFSADGKLLAAGGQDLKIYDVSTGKERATLQGHQGKVDSVAFSPDGATMASGSEDRTVKLWEVATGNGRTLGAHLDSVYCVAFSPDGKTLASGSVDRTINIWQTAAKLADACPEAFGCCPSAGIYARWQNIGFGGRIPDSNLGLGHRKGVHSQGANRGDGLHGAIPRRGCDCGGRCWKDRQAVESGHGADAGHFQAQTEVSGVAFSPDGKTLATWQSWRGDPRVSLWDVATQQLRATLAGGGNDSMISLVFSPDGKTLVAGGQNNSLIVWDVATGQQKLHVGLDRGSSSTWSVGILPRWQDFGHGGRSRDGRGSGT